MNFCFIFQLNNCSLTLFLYSCFMDIEDNMRDSKNSGCVMSHHYGATAPDKYIFFPLEILSYNNIWHLHTTLHHESAVQTFT